ncbi:MAG: carotenoid biosynthesis protein [Hyphomicrobium sp.]
MHGALRYGLRGILAFAGICLVVSFAIENIGVATGFPFGPYYYTDALGPKLGHVPLLIGPAYLGVGYVSWVLGVVLVGEGKARRR